MIAMFFLYVTDSQAVTGLKLGTRSERRKEEKKALLSLRSLNSGPSLLLIEVPLQHEQNKRPHGELTMRCN